MRHVLLVAAVLLGGCAYFNTFYNAKQQYKEAERTRRERSAQAAAQNYDNCIKKCLDLLRYHPGSGYVDDALFLIGMCHFHRGEYVQAQASFQDLLERFPKSEFAERAWFHMGWAALEQGDVAGAATAFESLGRDFPNSDYVVEAAYRTAEAQLGEDDEAARATLQAFIDKYADSRFVTEAQVEIARTYYDVGRFEEARREYARALERDLTDALRYEAELHVPLTKREQAAVILADPALYTSADLPQGLKLDFPEAGGGTSAAADTAAGSGTASEQYASVDALPESLRVQRQLADKLLEEAAKELDRLRKRAEKLGVELQHRIELAVTLSLMGKAEEAITELDQIARSAEPRTDVGANAYYEIGEINRRLGRMDKAQQAYDSAQRAKPDAASAKLALAKSTAIQARTRALDKLREAPDVLRRWRAARGLEPGKPDDAARPADSLTASVELEVRFEELASQMLRVAEIDLLELDQPRLALREFQRLLRDFAGSSQCPRAGFATGWIYENSLRDRPRALEAYESVRRDYPESPQARQALERIAALRAPVEEVGGSSSQP